MRTVKDVEAYLGRLNREFHEAEGQPGTFLVHTTGQTHIALRVDPPLVIVRVHIADVGKTDHADLFRRLLQLNAQGLVHAAYGLDDNRVVLSAALELENLDFNEIEATLDEIDIALVQQVPELVQLAKQA